MSPSFDSSLKLAVAESMDDDAFIEATMRLECPTSSASRVPVTTTVDELPPSSSLSRSTAVGNAATEYSNTLFEYCLRYSHTVCVCGFVFRRPFVKLFALCYQTVVLSVSLSVCLSVLFVLSVCDVGV